MRIIRSIFLLLVYVCAGSTMSSAEEAFILPEPKSYEHLDFYLLTVGPGKEVYTLFGHTILRVVDRERGLDMNFNWGIFDFNDPAFIFNFYKGHLNYLMEISDLESLLTLYRDYEHRQVIQEQINLTSLQKEKIFHQLKWNARSENRRYLYDQFLDNCSTKPRDLLDLGLGGKIKATFIAKDLQLTYRRLIRDAARVTPWVYFGLDISSNTYLDHPISPWDAMFLPRELREHLLTMRAMKDDGTPDVVPLLSNPQILVDHDEPRHSINPFRVLSLTGLLPIFIMVVGLKRDVRRMLGVVLLIFGVASGVLGSVLLSNWLFSGYRFLKGSAALFVFSPLDFYLVGIGMNLIKNRSIHANVRYFSYLRMAMVGFAILGFYSGFITQGIGELLWGQAFFIIVLFMTLIQISTRKLEALHETRS